MPEGRARHFGLLLLLSVALTGCGRQASSPSAATSDSVQLEAEAGVISPLAPQDIAEPRSGGKVIHDQGASGGQAVILLSNRDAAGFRLPANFTPDRYTVSVQAWGEFFQGWPTVALENDRRRRMSVTTLDTKSYALRGFGEFDLRPNQEMSISFLNDRYGGPGQDRNAVVDYLLIEPVGSRRGEYTLQFGSRGTDTGWDVAVDAGDNAYVVGTTTGVLPGQVGSEDGGPRSADAFIRKVNPRGQELWTRQFGTGGLVEAQAVTADAAGNSYVVGDVSGSLPGQTNQGYSDAFVRKYDAGGHEVWTRQFGGTGPDALSTVAVDAAGNVYVGGYTTVASSVSSTQVGLVRKYSAGGQDLWTWQPSSADDNLVQGVGVDALGNVYVAGYTFGAFPGFTNAGSADAFVLKLAADGTRLWVRQFGTRGSDPRIPFVQDSDYVTGVRVDAAGNVYLAGTVDGALPEQTSAGNADTFVRKYRPDGMELWTRQVGTSGQEVADLDLDGSGNVYLTWTSSPRTVFRFTPDGTLVQTRPLDFGGVPVNVGVSLVGGSGVAVGARGNLFVTGSTLGAFPGYTNAGDFDAFLLRRNP